MAAEPENAPQKMGAPVRSYVILERQELEDHDHCFVEIHRVNGRNGAAALRRAVRELRGVNRPVAQGSVLVVVPASYWNPKPVKLVERTTVSIAEE